jgi:replication factor A1
MKLEIVDNYGTPIECTFFNDAAKQFNDAIEQDKVYTFSNGNVSMANKKFTKVKNDYCIMFGKSAVIQLAKDDGSIAKQAFEFVKIGDIEEVQLHSVDVIGVVTDVSEQSSIQLKSGESKNKRTVTLVDQSSCTVTLTLWGDVMSAPVSIENN